MGVTAGEVSAAAGGKGGALSTFVMWPFMLFMGVTFFFNVVFFLSIWTLKNAAIYLFILSIFFPLFCSPFTVIGSKINAVVL